MDALMEEDRQRAIDRMNEEAQAKLDRQLEGKRFLQDQIDERIAQQRAAYEEHLREKAVVDEVVRGLQMEDIQKMKDHRERQRELRGNIMLYLEEKKKEKKEKKEKKRK